MASKEKKQKTSTTTIDMLSDVLQRMDVYKKEMEKMNVVVGK